MRAIIGMLVVFGVFFANLCFAETNEFIVKKGDNFWKLSKQYHVNHAKLINLNSNRLRISGNPNLIYPGQKFLVEIGSAGKANQQSQSAVKSAEKIAAVKVEIKKQTVATEKVAKNLPVPVELKKQKTDLADEIANSVKVEKKIDQKSLEKDASNMFASFGPKYVIPVNQLTSITLQKKAENKEYGNIYSNRSLALSLCFIGILACGAVLRRYQKKAITSNGKSIGELLSQENSRNISKLLPDIKNLKIEEIVERCKVTNKKEFNLEVTKVVDEMKFDVNDVFDPKNDRFFIGMDDCGNVHYMNGDSEIAGSYEQVARFMTKTFGKECEKYMVFIKDEKFADIFAVRPLTLIERIKMKAYIETMKIKS